MEAVVFELRKKELKFAKVPMPKVTAPKDVLIKVAYAGVCGTDLHTLEGHYPVKEDGPIILGHELSGVVVAVGADVEHVKPGDHVIVDPNNGCHFCHHCHEGEPHLCENLDRGIIGFFRDGGWAQYTVAALEQVYKIPSDIPLEKAALCEPLSCLTNGLQRAGDIAIGKTIMISGAGIIGNLWAIALHLKGHRNVTICEPNLSRLNQLKKLELGYTLITPNQLAENQKDPTYEFDVVIDCSGFGPAIENGINLIKRGGMYVQFGVPSPQTRVSLIPYEVYRKEATIIGIQLNPFCMERSVGLLQSLAPRYLNLSNLGIKLFTLSQYKEAIAELKAGSISKAMFKVE